jgi:hypothetical protein
LLILAALIATLALAFPAGAGAVTIAWHTVPGEWHAGGQFNPRPEITSLPALEASLRAPVVAGSPPAPGELVNFSLPDYGWEAPDGWWCRAGEVFAPSAIYTIPNPSGKPSGWWDTPQCRSMTVGPEGLHWFTDPGTESVGCVCNGVHEYPLPSIPAATQGYPGDPYPTPGAITTVGSELWVASSSGEGMFSVSPTASPARVARHHRRHRRSRCTPTAAAS